MEHDGLEDLNDEQVDAMQEGIDKLIASNRADKATKDRGKNKAVPKCIRCGVDGHNIFDCRDNPERNDYCYKL